MRSDLRAAFSFALCAVAPACGTDDGRARSDAGGDARRDTGRGTDPVPLTTDGGSTTGGTTSGNTTSSGGGSTGTVGPCGGTSRSLSQSRAEVILVIDRSNSMLEPDRMGVPKWTTLRGSLRAALPRVQTNLSMGMVGFPKPLPPSPPGVTPPVSEVCGVLTRLEVEPRFENATAVIAAVDGSNPGGSTPTYAGLQTAVQYFQTTPDPVGRRYLVLATDGGPNCNAASNPMTCRCTGNTQQLCRNPANAYGPTNCLDDARVVATIRELAGRGIQTFVIGLPGTESFSDVLDAMAEAGGRARPGMPRYYNATSGEELTAALGAITSSITDCRFRLDAPPSDPDMVDVRLGGRSVFRDRRRMNGWEWADAQYREIVFHGAACVQVTGATGGEALVAAFGCPPVPAPG